MRRPFQARKAGHTGSLDPLASGLLPICLGQATKASGLLLDADKTYRFRIALGARTATGDREGDVSRDGSRCRRSTSGRAHRDGGRFIGESTAGPADVFGAQA